MKKTCLKLIALSAVILTLSSHAASAETTMDGTEELKGHKVYNYFNGDQPTGPARPYKKLTEMSETTTIIEDGQERTTTVSTEANFVTYCPPGMAKEECAKTRNIISYKKGEMIPEEIEYMSASADFLSSQPAPVAGTSYVTMGRDIYLVDDATRKVLSVYTKNAQQASDTYVAPKKRSYNQ